MVQTKKPYLRYCYGVGKKTLKGMRIDGTMTFLICVYLCASVDKILNLEAIHNRTYQAMIYLHTTIHAF